MEQNIRVRSQIIFIYARLCTVACNLLYACVYCYRQLMAVSQSLQELHEMFYDLAVLVEEQVATASFT